MRYEFQRHYYRQSYLMDLRLYLKLHKKHHDKLLYYYLKMMKDVVVVDDCEDEMDVDGDDVHDEDDGVDDDENDVVSDHWMLW